MEETEWLRARLELISSQKTPKSQLTAEQPQAKRLEPTRKDPLTPKAKLQ